MLLDQFECYRHNDFVLFRVIADDNDEVIVDCDTDGD